MEWILLGLAVVSELPWDGIPYLRQISNPWVTSKLIPFSSLLTLLCIVVFGLIGLRLPSTSKTIGKLIYTALELGLIWLASALGAWQSQFLFLYLIVVVRSCLIFEAKARLLVAGSVFLSYLLALLVSFQDIHNIQNYLPGLKRVDPDKVGFFILFLIINSALLFGLVLVFMLVLVNALLSERQSRHKLASTYEQLRRYAQRIEDQATLQERNRIAREIHDSLGHALTAQCIQLENALLFCQSNTEKTQVFLTEARQLGAKALKEIRQSISALRSNPLQGQSLELAMTTLVEEFRRTTNIAPDYTVCLSHPVTSEVSAAIYRIAQEALTNISKHSSATEVTIQLQTKVESLHFVVIDNGKGFKPEQNTTGFGLQGMRERTLALLGSIKIVSEPGAGCCVSVDIPLAKFVV